MTSHDVSRMQKVQAAMITAQRHLDIVKRAANGDTYEEIGNVYNVTRQRVEHIIKKLSTNNDMAKMVVGI